MAGDRYLTNVSGVETYREGKQSSAGAGDAGKLIALNSSGLINANMLSLLQYENTLQYNGTTASTADSDPGTGTFRFNNVSPASVTFIYIDDTDTHASTDFGALFGALKQGDVIYIQDYIAHGQSYIFTVSGATIDGTSYWKIPVTHQSGTSGLNNNLYNFTFLASGHSPATVHERGGTYEINGDHLDIDFTPSNYTPSTTPSEADNVDDLAAHLAGIDDALVRREHLIQYNADTASQADSNPGSGTFRFNNVSPASVTFIYINDTTPDAAPDYGALFAALKSGDKIFIQDQDQHGETYIFEVSGSATDGTGYWKIPVTHDEGTSGLNANIYQFTFLASGGITSDSATTFTNKTFDANGTGNSLSNVDVADLANGTDGELITWDATGAPATVSVGTSGQVLTSNGAGAAPTFQNAAAGASVSVAVICDSKAANTHGGTFTSGAWRTRDLNTELSDIDGIVSITSNEFTLGAGTYLIDWSCPAYIVGHHKSRLYDVTGAAAVDYGSVERAATTATHVTRSVGSTVIAPGSSNTYRIEHYCQTTRATDGFGSNYNISVAEVYTIVKIIQIA